MQRLVHLECVAGGKTRRHRLYALALDRQHWTFRVVLDGNDTIGMPGYLRQTVQIGLQAPGWGREIRLATAQPMNLLSNNHLRLGNQNKGR
jgi:hypothetical protein